MSKENYKKKQKLKNIRTATALTITLATSNVSTLAYAMELENKDIKQDVVSQEQEIFVQEEVTTQEVESDVKEQEVVVQGEETTQESELDVKEQEVVVQEKVTTKNSEINTKSTNNQSTVDNFNLSDWEFKEFKSTNTIVLYKYNGSSTDIVIPGEINGMLVKIASIDCFSTLKDTLTSITFKEVGGNKIQTPVSLSKLFSDFINLKEVDLGGLDTSTVNNMSSMFTNCTSLTNITFGDTFNTSNVTNMSSMFRGCSSLENLDLSKFDKSQVLNMSYMFKDCTNLKNLNLSKFDTHKVSDMRYMFDGCKSLISIDLSKFNTSNVEHMRYMFNNCESLSNLDLGNFDTRKTSDIDNMFKGCSSLTSLDLSSFNTENVITMTNLFLGCSSLTDVNLSSFNTSNVTKMNNMFKDCSSLKNLDLKNFDTTSVTDMSYMFSDTSIINLDLSSFNTSNVTSMSGIFRNTKNLDSINFGNEFKTKSVENMSYMFSGSGVKSLDLSKFDTTSVTSTKAMFALLDNITVLDLSSFNLEQVTDMESMFGKNITVDNATGNIENNPYATAKELLVVTKDQKLKDYNYMADFCLPVGPTLHANGGQFTNGDITVDLKTNVLESLDENYINKEIQDRIASVEEPTRDGYTFISWETSQIAKANFSILDKLNTVYYAKWEAFTPVTLPDDVPVEDEEVLDGTDNDNMMVEPSVGDGTINQDEENQEDNNSSIPNQNNGSNSNDSTSNFVSKYNPQTGDTGVLGSIGLGLTSIVGIFITNRKKKK